jgi:hypothetical protein
MNFASVLAANQRTRLRDDARGHAGTARSTLSYMLDRLSPMRYEDGPYDELLSYLQPPGSTWTGSDASLLVKVPGLAHLILGSSEYQCC